MPIRPERRHLYPENWPELSRYIRFHRALGFCECTGECGLDHGVASYGEPGHCLNTHGLQMDSGAVCVLTVAHLDHDETHNDPSNLQAMCQGCHNRYDMEHRREGIRRREREAMETEGQLTLDDVS